MIARAMSELSSFSFELPESARLLLELEARQDDVLRELDALNMRIERTITSGQMSIAPGSSAIPALTVTAINHVGLSAPTC
jgi:hypothetical protein